MYLYADIENKWPPIFLIPPAGSSIKEGSYINYSSDYYSFEKITFYKSQNGFEKKAFVFKGYKNDRLRKEYIQGIDAQQWIDGSVNIKGM